MIASISTEPKTPAAEEAGGATDRPAVVKRGRRTEFRPVQAAGDAGPPSPGPHRFHETCKKNGAHRSKRR